MQSFPRQVLLALLVLCTFVTHSMSVDNSFERFLLSSTDNEVLGPPSVLFMGNGCFELPPPGVANIAFAVKVRMLPRTVCVCSCALFCIVQEHRVVMASFWPWPGVSHEECATVDRRRIEELVCEVRLSFVCASRCFPRLLVHRPPIALSIGSKRQGAQMKALSSPGIPAGAW